jgi:hypothetical protein
MLHRASAILLGAALLVHAPLALRHQQHDTARDLPGGRRCLLLWFGAQLLGQPTHDPLGDGEFLQLVTHFLKLPAQLLHLHLQFNPASRDQLTNVRFRILGHLTHLPPGERKDTRPCTPWNPRNCDHRSGRRSCAPTTAHDQHEYTNNDSHQHRDQHVQDGGSSVLRRRSSATAEAAA